LKTNYYFLVDRSGSMGFPQQKMPTMIETIKLALLSLPAGSSFQVIGYGSRF